MTARFLSPILLAGILTTAGAAPQPSSLSLGQLEIRLQDIERQLAQLANYNPSGGVGAIGSRSRAYDAPEQAEWIEIDLGATVSLDEVLLVPAIRRDGVNGFQADGFPRSFRLRAGSGDDRTGTIVAEFSGRDALLPRIAPLVIPCAGLQASWIRVEATLLSRREFDSRFVLQFSEILAFRGDENVALHRPVKFPPNHEPNSAPGWPDSAIVDGFLPYLMAAASGEKSVAYLSPPNLAVAPTLMVDLGANHALSRLQLHAVDQSDTVPQAFAGDVGIPRVLRVEGATTPDFSDARLLLELRHDSIYDVGPILVRTFPTTTCRYVRLVAVEPDPTSPSLSGPPRLGFAEIEFFPGAATSRCTGPSRRTTPPPIQCGRSPA